MKKVIQKVIYISWIENETFENSEETNWLTSLCNSEKGMMYSKSQVTVHCYKRQKGQMFNKLKTKKKFKPISDYLKQRSIVKWCDLVLLGVFSEHLLLAKVTQAQSCKNKAWHPLPSRSLSAKIATGMNCDKHGHPGVVQPFSLFTTCINLYMMHFSTFLFSKAVLWFIY